MNLSHEFAVSELQGFGWVKIISARLVTFMFLAVGHCTIESNQSKLRSLLHPLACLLKRRTILEINGMIIRVLLDYDYIGSKNSF